MMQYNSSLYNKSQYNLNAVSLSLADTTMPFISSFTDSQLTSSFGEILVLSDNFRPFNPFKKLVESLFSNDTVRADLTNKAVNDIIFTSDWLSIIKNPAQNIWD